MVLKKSCCIRLCFSRVSESFELLALPGRDSETSLVSSIALEPASTSRKSPLSSGSVMFSTGSGTEKG